jgi:pyruvate ferredoxin oxidoreductase alpha subunit
MTKEINGQRLFLKGSTAIAKMVAACQPGVVAAYPITPQTGIIEHLAELSGNGLADFSFIQTESEHSAISAVLGAAAMGVSAYTATSSQGLLHMAEVVYNLPGLRLPLVMTCANRSISAPINIWNDHQDAMAVREAGWPMFFAENIQEAIEQHWLAFVISQKLRLPAMVNVDGFRLTHASEPVALPSSRLIKKILKNKIKPILNINQPQTTGWFTMPKDYQKQRLDLKKIIDQSQPIIEKAYCDLINIWQKPKQELSGVKPSPLSQDNVATEYYGPKQPNWIIVAMGSIIGELKELADQYNQHNQKVGILKIKLYRPFPEKIIWQYLKLTKNIIIIDRSPGLGAKPPLFSDIKASQPNDTNLIKIVSLIIGLGGDINFSSINKIMKKI